jgi:hypothetical protein
MPATRAFQLSRERIRRGTRGQYVVDDRDGGRDLSRTDCECAGDVDAPHDRRQCRLLLGRTRADRDAVRDR